MEQAAFDQVVQMLCRNGLWDPGVLAAYNQPPGQLPHAQQYWILPPTDPKYPGLVKPDGTIDTTSPNYYRWITDNGSKQDWIGDIKTAFINPGPTS